MSRFEFFQILELKFCITDCDENYQKKINFGQNSNWS